MVDLYSAVAIQPKVYRVRRRAEIKRNLDRLCTLIDYNFFQAYAEIPPKLFAIPEACLQGAYDEVIDMDPQKYIKEIAMEIPGEETDVLAEKAKQYRTYIIATAKALERKIAPKCFFNTVFVIDPRGKVVHKHYKLQIAPGLEASTSPHDVLDIWVEKFGDGLNAFFPVVDTEIGKLGTMICMEGSYPEEARGLALNGAEIIYRPSYPEPWLSAEWFEIQNRARALDNTVYLVSPNYAYLGGFDDSPPEVVGGNSMIIDYRGQFIAKAKNPGETCAIGIINIEELREYRSKALFGNFLTHLRMECYRKMYDQTIYPPNLCLDDLPMTNSEKRKFMDKVIESMYTKGIYTRPRNGKKKDQSKDIVWPEIKE